MFDHINTDILTKPPQAISNHSLTTTHSGLPRLILSTWHQDNLKDSDTINVDDNVLLARFKVYLNLCHPNKKNRVSASGLDGNFLQRTTYDSNLIKQWFIKINDSTIRSMFDFSNPNYILKGLDNFTGRSIPKPTPYIMINIMNESSILGQ